MRHEACKTGPLQRGQKSTYKYTPSCQTLSINIVVNIGDYFGQDSFSKRQIAELLDYATDLQCCS